MSDPVVDLELARAHGLSDREAALVIEILGRWRFEREYLASLGIDPRHHVLDSAIFASRI